MGDRTTTVIIEPRSLMREALVSLMESLSYQVVCSVGSTAEINRTLGDAQPELVILGSLPAESAVEAMRRVRECWEGAKITMLFEQASSMDLQRLMAAGLDACIPMFASPRTLTDTLQLVVGEQLRILMLSGSSKPCTPDDSMKDQPEALEEPRATVPLLPSFQLPGSQVSFMASSVTKSSGDSAGQRGLHGLSEREEQILRALVRGHSNKVIARMCTVTEATVKVHVKSILRKIRVANRTQAAIWALKNSYVTHDGGVNDTTPAMPATGGLASPLASGQGY
jgi:two-component system nitrate/nitrite response regulator NarL